MEFSVTNQALRELVNEEVSRVADLAYSEEGVSLYDSIAIFDRDKDTIDRMIADASSVVYERFRDYIVSPTSAASDSVNISFYLPDMETSQASVATQELKRFLSYQVVALWLQERYATAYEKYATRATSALEKAELALFTRKRVTRDAN